MRRDVRLLAGPLAAALLLLGIVGLARLVPGYDDVRQTVSEIGEVGSPARLAFTVLLCLVAAGLAVFAAALHEVAKAAGVPRWGAWLTGGMAISVAGVGVFAFPHPLHNVFGISELIGYQAPLAVALTWRGDPRLRQAVVLSAAMAVVVWVAIALNLSSLSRTGALWATLKPVYGLVQRALFAAWFGWCALLGATLYRSARA